MRIFYISILTLFASSAMGQSGAAQSASLNSLARIIKFYPNPATTQINFDFQRDYDKTHNFQIFNFLGKKVFESNNVSSKTIVNLNEFYRGIYIFQLRDRNGKIIDSGKFQVSK